MIRLLKCRRQYGLLLLTQIIQHNAIAFRVDEGNFIIDHKEEELDFILLARSSTSRDKLLQYCRNRLSRTSSSYSCITLGIIETPHPEPHNNATCALQR
jgi:hypothetical protein